MDEVFKAEYTLDQAAAEAGKRATSTLYVFLVPTVDRMFTTRHLSDHVQDNMTSRLHQQQRLGALPWCVPVCALGAPLPAREGCG